jgi:guanylate kinase
LTLGDLGRATGRAVRIAAVPKVFVITGPSGVGKGTLMARLRERVPGLALSVSATTRRPREGEVDGRDYHFLEPEEFERLVGEGAFLEHASYSGNRYGTLRSEVERHLAEGRSVLLEIEVQGARQVSDAMDDAVLIFISPGSPEVLRQRLEARGTDSPEAIERRLRVAEEELAAEDEFTHTLVNDDLDRATAELEEIVRRELAD